MSKNVILNLCIKIHLNVYINVLKNVHLNVQLNVHINVYLSVHLNFHLKMLKLVVTTSPGSTDWRESRSRFDLETRSTETLGLVPVSYKIFEVVSSRSCLG